MNKRILIDIIMAVCMLIAISYRIIDGIYHEIIGMILLLFFILHNILNIKWYKNLVLNKYKWRRISIMIVNIALVIFAITLIFTGIIHSKELFGLASEEETVTSSWKIHTLAAYWVFILVSIHLGIYWSTILYKIPFMKNKMVMLISKITIIIISLFGIKEFINRNIGSKLILYYSFDFWHTSEPLYSYIASYFAIMCLFALVTYYLIKFKNHKWRIKHG